MRFYHNSRRNLLFLTLFYLAAAVLVATVCNANPQAAGGKAPAEATPAPAKATDPPAAEPTGGAKGGAAGGAAPTAGGTGGTAKEPATGTGNTAGQGGAKGNGANENTNTTPNNNNAAATGGGNGAKDGQPTTTAQGAKAAPVTAALPTKATQAIGDASQGLPTLPANPYAGINGTMSWQQCVDYGKYCRDVICPYQNYTATCKRDGGCTCFGPIYSKGDPAVNYYFTGIMAIVTILSFIFGILY